MLNLQAGAHVASGRRPQVRGVSIAVTVESNRLDVSGCMQKQELSSDLG